tara:strand:+ start:30 stop:563 length:534 start_codon:yes stop_codon:yes gene_type:complete
MSKEVLELNQDGLMELAQEARVGYIEHGTVNVEIKLPDRKNNFKRKVERVEHLPDVTLDDIVVLPCLAQSALGHGNPIHKARFHLASYLAARFRWFFPPEAVDEKVKAEHVNRICNIIENQDWVDYDSDITRGHVESIVIGNGSNNGYAASSCRKLEYDGLCTGRCRYYDGSIEEME